MSCLFVLEDMLLWIARSRHVKLVRNHGQQHRKNIQVNKPIPSRWWIVGVLVGGLGAVLGGVGGVKIEKSFWEY